MIGLDEWRAKAQAWLQSRAATYAHPARKHLTEEQDLALSRQYMAERHAGGFSGINVSPQFDGPGLSPLHKVHVCLLCTSGLLNGVFGSAGERHGAYWERVKVVDRIEEEGEGADTTVIREKERFSQRLTLLYADGRIELLAERPAPSKNGDTRDEERTSANGQADVCAPDAGHGDERFESPASACF